jgi:hypothetical protein
MIQFQWAFWFRVSGFSQLSSLLKADRSGRLKAGKPETVKLWSLQASQFPGHSAIFLFFPDT